MLCHQQHEQGLQNELSQVRRRLAELEQLYSQQKSVAGDAQLQADELLRRLAQLERELRDAREDKVMSPPPPQLWLSEFIKFDLLPLSTFR